MVGTWIPDGGFEIQRRKVKAADGGSVVTECLVPKWSNDELTVDRPLHRQPCLHCILADCGHDQTVRLASLYGLPTATIPRRREPGKTACADVPPPEPLDAWHREIRALRAATEMLDTGKNRDLLARRTNVWPAARST